MDGGWWTLSWHSLAHSIEENIVCSKQPTHTHSSSKSAAFSVNDVTEDLEILCCVQLLRHRLGLHAQLEGTHMHSCLRRGRQVLFYSILFDCNRIPSIQNIF